MSFATIAPNALNYPTLVSARRIGIKSSQMGGFRMADMVDKSRDDKEADRTAWMPKRGVREWLGPMAESQIDA